MYGNYYYSNVLADYSNRESCHNLKTRVELSDDNAIIGYIYKSHSLIIDNRYGSLRVVHGRMEQTQMSIHNIELTAINNLLAIQAGSRV